MQNQKFTNPNILAEEALLELRHRIAEVDPTEFEIENKENILKISRLKANPIGVKNQ